MTEEGTFTPFVLPSRSFPIQATITCKLDSVNLAHRQLKVDGLVNLGIY
jgi:hypothetical protein